MLPNIAGALRNKNIFLKHTLLAWQAWERHKEK